LISLPYSYDYCILGSPTPAGTAVPAVPAVPAAITMAPSTSIPGPVVEVNPLRPPLDFVGDLEYSVIGNPLGFCQGKNGIEASKHAHQPPVTQNLHFPSLCPVAQATAILVSICRTDRVSNLRQRWANAESFHLNADDDCLDNLVCFQRESFEPVPGCSGSGLVSTHE
jgi:hypothetical protein